MSDIMERLRLLCSQTRGAVCMQSDEMTKLLDEIGRLRTENGIIGARLEGCRLACDLATNELEQLRPEIERLRSTLGSWSEEPDAEIEQLRVENADLRVSNVTLDESNMKLRAEIERLRAPNDVLIRSALIKDEIIAAHIDNFMKQDAEIERLRASIRRLQADMDLNW